MRARRKCRGGEFIEFVEFVELLEFMEIRDWRYDRDCWRLEIRRDTVEINWRYVRDY